LLDESRVGGAVTVHQELVEQIGDFVGDPRGVGLGQSVERAGFFEAFDVAGCERYLTDPDQDDDP
jgi:hypothetical protein